MGPMSPFGMRPGYNYGPSLPNVPSDARNLLGLQPTPTPDTAGILAGQAADREKQGYLAGKRKRDEEQFSTSAETLLGITPRESGPYSRDRLRQRVSNIQGAQRKTANIAANTAAEKAGRPQDIVNILSGRLQSQVDRERQREEAKRATRSEYRKTGQRVEPGTIAARQLLESYMPQGLIPGDLPLAAMAGGPQGSPWRNAAEALAPMGPMQAMEKDKELDRGLKREEMASREIAAGLQGQSPQTSELIQQRKAGQTQQPATSIRPRGVAPQNEVAPGKTNELAVAAYMKALGDPATAAAALAAGISKEQAAQNTVAKEHGPAAAQAAAQAVHGQAIEEANKPFWNPDTSTFWPGRNPETGKVWERPFLRAPLDPLLHIIRSLSGA